jgi:hypothetical protein
MGDTLEHAVGIAERLIVPETKHAIPEAFEERGATSVGGRPCRVLTAVQLHDQPPLAAAEVDDVGADRDLARELRAGETPVAEARPEAALGVGLAPTQATREVAG